MDCAADSVVSLLCHT